MLCKQENRDPAHCLKEGRRVTRCATDLYVSTIIHCVGSIQFSLLIFQDHKDEGELPATVR